LPPAVSRPRKGRYIVKGGGTLYDKVWDDHVIEELDGGMVRLAIDRELV
jgi:hypothetical protein